VLSVTENGVLPNGTDSIAFIVMKNGVVPTGAPTCTITGSGNQGCQDNNPLRSVDYNVGDTIALRMTASIANTHPFTATWTLQGPTSFLTGVAGPTGPTGPTGVAGATGPAGGPTGPTGPTGLGSATVAIGTTTTGSAGSSALVTNTGSGTAAILNFTIPQGATGPAGSVASIATGPGLTGGPITSSGTIDMATAQKTRTICYIAGSDNNSAPIDTTYSQKSFFNNMIGSMTVTAASCQVDAGSATLQVFKNNLGTAITGAATACNSTPGSPFQALSLSGTPSLSLTDTLDLSITAASTAKRLTVCVAGTVD
jgi:hypothetical protein